jgi:hypothetical protein
MRLAVALLTVALLALESRPDAGQAGLSPQGAMPRTVLALYDGALAPRVVQTDIHRVAEMPLNFLGVVVHYHDIQRGLPPVESLVGVRGVLTWFTSNVMDEPEAYLRWATRVMDSGRRMVVVGSIGALQHRDGRPVAGEALESFLARLGLERTSGWTTTTYGIRYLSRDARMVEFERPLPSVVPPFDRFRALSGARSYLTVAGSAPDTRSDLVVVGPRGGYVAPGYAVFTHRYRQQTFMQWYLNPFEFFREALETDELPKPDPSTTSGRRAFYSHIDGDGWRNVTHIEPYRKQFAVAARVVLEEIIRKYPDFPVTVGPIAGDIDPRWHGTRASIEAARETLALPHVEASVHTYSHPLDWEFFRDAAPGDEEKYRRGEDDAPTVSEAVNAGAGEHATPRSYTNAPFELVHEIDGAAALVEGLLPPGKKVGVIQWSGDTRIYEAALAQARSAGLANINGGDTRFDREFPSHAWVAPLSREVGRERQVYSSNSNENTYTDLWRNRFFGFRFLMKTIRNTGIPRRLKPFNLYYHMYSGERLSSLNAVRANLDYARTLDLAPVTTSRFARSVEGFFSTRITSLGPRRWRVSERKALQTLRIDAASRLAIDFSRSVGVVGQRHANGSLFVALDEAVPIADVALLELASATSLPAAQRPFLVDGRWRVWNVKAAASSVSFDAEGFGEGAMTWRWPKAGIVRVEWSAPHSRGVGQLVARSDDEGFVRVSLPNVAQAGAHVRMWTEGGPNVAP